MAQIQIAQGTGHTDRGHIEMAGQLGNRILFQQRQGTANFVALAVEPLRPSVFPGRAERDFIANQSPRHP